MQHLALYPHLSRYHNLENTRRKAHLIKWRSMENLDRLLHEFESQALRRGMHVIWANDETEARDEMTEILRDHGVGRVSYAEDMLSRELDLAGTLTQAGISTAEGSSTADAQIRSADFLIAETGTIVLPGLQRQRQPGQIKTQIVLAGIESIIPHLTDIHLFQPLLSSHSKEGRRPDSFSFTLINADSSRENTYIILLDNGRTELLAATEQRQGLYCIGCEACLHVCPVYQQTGDDRHSKAYTGPIGSLITPHTQGMKAFKHLSERSTLCGQCNEVCPVNIDISRMLLLNRRDAVHAGLSRTQEKVFWKTYTQVMGKRKWIDFLGARTKNFLLRIFLKKNWGNKRSLPRFEKRSFGGQRKDAGQKPSTDSDQLDLR